LNPDSSRLVLLPSYNSGAQLVRTARAALAEWAPVWIVLDGSTDESVAAAHALAAESPQVRVITLPQNAGKGGAVLAGLRAAREAGFTHVVVMDADGQHPASAIRPFMRLSEAKPSAMILGVPVFGPDAPPERVKGRRVGNWFTHLETLWGGVEDSLFGFRLYPVAPALEILLRIRTARRFDFDTELVVRLFWAGVEPVNVPVPVTYPPRDRGGITHFHYVRDNLLLAGTHTRLCLLLLTRLGRVWTLRTRWKNATSSLPPVVSRLPER
jgi:glycosyltransferase involved in cell wall biosynthesis